MVRRGALQVGDHVQLRGPKGILHTITLEAGGSFHTHKGQIFHDDLIGHPEGSVVTTDRDVAYLALRPMLSDFVLIDGSGCRHHLPQRCGADCFPG
jgi:tRNA (adenine57-N1/adenine58-N1)-methyltransferase